MEKFSRFYDEWRQECKELDRENEAIPEPVNCQASLEAKAMAETAGPQAREDMEAETMAEMAGPQALEEINANFPKCEPLTQEDEMPKTADPEADRDIHADIPDMLSSMELNAFEGKIKEESARRKIIDRQAVAKLKYDGKRDPMFTPQEQYLFSCALKQYRKEVQDHENPSRKPQKQGTSMPSKRIFGVIAELLPGRTYKDCLNYYYRYKWDGRFQNKALKEHGQKSNWRYQDSGNELSPDSEPSAVSSSGHVVKASKKATRQEAMLPDLRFMTSLRKQVTEHEHEQMKRILHSRDAMVYPEKVQLCIPSLYGLEPASRQLFFRRQDYMLNWLQSPGLIQIKEWMDTVTSDRNTLIFKRFLATFTTRSKQLDRILGKKQDGTLFVPSTPSEYCQCYVDAVHAGATEVVHQTGNCEEEVVAICTMCILSISKGSWCGTFDEPELGQSERWCLIADVLLWAYHDYVSDEKRFFRTLLNSPLAQLQDYRVRKQLKELYELSVGW